MGNPRKRSSARATMSSDARRAQRAQATQTSGGRRKRRDQTTSQHVEPNPETMEPCKDKDELLDFAKDKFIGIEGKGVEGRPGEVYVDCLGHPTIGIGHLVVHKIYVLGGTDSKGKYHAPDPKAVDQCREKFIELPLLDKNGKPMSDAQKGAKFDQMINLMKSKGRALTNDEIKNLNLGHLSEEGMDQIYRKDHEKFLKRAVNAMMPDGKKVDVNDPDFWEKTKESNFWKMTRSAQVSFVHGYFWGKGKTMDKLAESCHQDPYLVGQGLPKYLNKGLKPNRAIQRNANQAESDSTAVQQQRQLQLQQQRIPMQKGNQGR